MIKFLIKYEIYRKGIGTVRHALVEVATYTKAYLFFMCKYPSFCLITEISETTGEELPEGVEYPQRIKSNYTICK